MRARNNWVIAKRLSRPEITKSGLLLPDSAAELPNIATVISVGSKVRNITIGQLVVFSKYHERSYEDLLILRDTEILATIDV